jgi:formate/nitrite transporter
MYAPEEIVEIAIKNGLKKTQKTQVAKCLLGFIGGAMISLGYLAYIRISAAIPATFSGLGTLLGAAIFPIGLIVILLAGGELITGNMMAVTIAFYDHRVSYQKLLANWALITIANMIGAIFVAYFFGHFVGLTHTNVFKEQVIAIAQHKINASFTQSFISGIGCNWFVGLALWLCYGAKEAIGKIVAIWFPVTVFVAIGFQHSVANCFVIPAAIFEGGATWEAFVLNFIPVYLGNIVGGALLVSGFYYLSYSSKITAKTDKK